MVSQNLMGNVAIEVTEVLDLTLTDNTRLSAAS